MKKIKILLIVLVLILSGIFFNQVNAVNLYVQPQRPFDTEDDKGANNEKADEENDTYRFLRGVDGLSNGYAVFKIYEENDDTEFKVPYYCLRGRVGFGANGEVDVSSGPVAYTKIGEMHKNSDCIIEAYNTTYSKINNGKVNISNNYNEILWILDNLYLPKDNEEYNAAEYKAYLLNKVGLTDTQIAAITDDDIEVIQQLALWYFSNYDENGNEKSVSRKEENIASLLGFFKKDTDGKEIFDNDNYINNMFNEGTARGDALDELYMYFINGANENAIKYGEENSRNIEPISREFDKSLNLTIESIDEVDSNPARPNPNNHYYKVGPFKIGSNEENIIPKSDITILDKNERKIEKYSFINEKNEGVDELHEGNVYYLKILKVAAANLEYDMSKVTIKTSGSYWKNTSEVFKSTENPEKNQIVVNVDKELSKLEDEITVKSQFDLSLRKFIKGIKRGITDIEFSSRAPQINIKTLIEGRKNEAGETEYTATYTHPKFALPVETGDIVTYAIRIYNEGKIDGTATLVTDYLPSGLEFIKDSEINARYGWKVSEDGKTLTTDYLKNTIIKAFDITKTTHNTGHLWQFAEDREGGLYYAELQIECKVIATPEEEAKTLRNIAAITEDTEDDRDSIPGKPDLDKYNPGEDNSTYQEDDDDYEDLKLRKGQFDLSLRKFIEVIDENKVEPSREPVINTTSLIEGRKNEAEKTEYTATYTHPKNKLTVHNGSTVIYTIRVYNEGELDGAATLVTDYLPDGLEFIDDSEINQKYKWIVSEDGKTLTTDYLKDTIIKAFDITKEEKEEGELWQKASEGNSGLYYADLQVECIVVATSEEKEKTLRNIAAITEDTEDDRDSIPGEPDLDDYNPGEDNSTYQEDDDDYEDLVLPGKYFDLALRKYIDKINGEDTESSRAPQIDTSKLNKVDTTTGKRTTTATYIHSKEPLVVKKGDIITYKIRIYNEGQRDGYATKVTDYLPDGLGFLYTANGNINSDWILTENLEISPLYGENGIYASEEKILKKDAYKNVFGEEIELDNIQVIQGKASEDGTRELLKLTAGGTINETNIKATDLIKAYGSTKAEGDLWQQSINDENDGLFYQELEITCLVLKENTYKGILKNIAEITAAEDSNGIEIIAPGDDRDSEPNNVYDDNEHNPGTEINGYTPGEQDDDDFEPVILQYFDLALRKFITSVESNGNKEEISTRIPTVKLDEDEKIRYEHSKDPVYVANGDIVTYTIRVYNEGTIDGYAEEVTDDLPEGLEFLPDNETNIMYEWEMIDKEGKVTKNVKDAVKVTTNHLSKEKSSEDVNNLIKAFDNSKELSTVDSLNPDYRDVKIAFKVIEPNTSDRIITNMAQISEDSDDDEDSIPDEWNEGEDDQDKEYIYVKYFDLSLLKWVTETIVTVDGKTTITETGFKPNTGKTETTEIRNNDEAEPIAKVEIDKKKVNKTTVKFAYKIRVTNEGEIEGYATEITDFIPEGLEFVEEDNKEFGWVKEGDNKVTTRALETKLLKPGESAEVSITFTWKNNVDNLGLKTNIAEITEDYNKNNSEDIDSIPDNKKDPYEKEQEDDDDFALVILSIGTGTGKTIEYTIFVISIITMLATGIYLVKKYVLTY